MKWVKIKKIEKTNNKETVYNFSCYPYDNYFANNILVHNCTYCVNRYLHELYEPCGKYILRRYTARRIVDELKWLTKKYKLEFFKFFDEDFLMRPTENLREFGELYAKEVGVKFWIETNPKSTTEEKVKILKDMNCVGASLGIETGNLEVRKEILQRVDTKENMVNAYRLLKKYGIKTSSYNMFGLPFETREKYMDTVNLNRLLNPDMPQMDFFYPFEHTILRDVSIENGFFDPDDKTTEIWTSSRPHLHFPNLTKEQLQEMQKVFTLYVKFPVRYEKFIERSETLDEIGIKLRKKLMEIYDETVFANEGTYKDNGKEKEYIMELDKLRVR